MDCIAAVAIEPKLEAHHRSIPPFHSIPIPPLLFSCIRSGTRIVRARARRCARFAAVTTTTTIHPLCIPNPQIPIMTMNPNTYKSMPTLLLFQTILNSIITIILNTILIMNMRAHELPPRRILTMNTDTNMTMHIRLRSLLRLPPLHRYTT